MAIWRYPVLYIQSCALTSIVELFVVVQKQLFFNGVVVTELGNYNI